MNRFVVIEPISVGELLTVISSIILLIITWKSVSNAKKANEITEKSLQLQSNQFIYSIKPELTFDIPPIKYTEEENDKTKINRLIYPDHNFQVRNLSSNTCYNINVTTLIYMPNESWDKYYFFLSNEFDKSKSRPNIISNNDIYSLHSTNKLECTIPFYYLILDIIAYDGTIIPPNLFVFIKYEDKIKNFYEDCFELKSIGSTKGRFKGSDKLEIKFKPVRVDSVKIKEKLYKQKKKLEDDFPDKPKLFYNSL